MAEPLVHAEEIMRASRVTALVVVAIVTGFGNFGCAKKIQVQKLAGGDIDICGVHKVGVGSFKISANKVSPALTSTIVGKLTQGIANEKQLDFFVRDPDELGKIAREIEEYHDKGTLTQRSLSALQAAGLEGIIFGDITAASLTDAESSKDVEVDSKTHQYVHNVYRQRTADLVVNYKMIDVRPDSPCGTLRTLVAQSANETATWEMLVSGDASVDSIGNAVDTSLENMFGSPDKGKAKAIQKVAQLPTEISIFDSLADQSVGKFLKKIQPHIKKGTVRIQSASTPRGELGVSYAMNCNWDQAEKTLEEAVKDGQGSAADYYNLAIVKDLKGCRKEATELMGKAVDLDPSDGEAIAAHAKLLDDRELGNFEPEFVPADLVNTTSKDVCPIKVGCGAPPPPVVVQPIIPRCTTTDRLTLRSAGNKDAKAIKSFPKGTELRIDDESGSSSWARIHIEVDGKAYDGWGYKQSYECKAD